MSKSVAVLDSEKKALSPCHPAVARRLLREGKAAVFKRYPFTIILKKEVEKPAKTDLTLSIDPGSKVTGIAITDPHHNIIALFELHHRGNAIKKSLTERAGHRRSRRTRKLRHRQSRFDNRSRKAPVLTQNGWTYKSFGQSSKGWIAPSLMSRVFNIHTWVDRLRKIYPINKIAIEHVKFDTQLMNNPEISGIEYQRGTLFESEVWEYLLEKFGRKCYYCGAKNIPLEKEHILPKSKGGTNRVDNLTISCKTCNQEKGNQHPDEIQGKLGKRAQQALRAAGKPLKDAQAVNTIRWKIVETLKATGLPIIYGTGGKTKWHRKHAGLPKSHYYDAACVSGIAKQPSQINVLSIHAIGYGDREGLGNQISSGDGIGYPLFKKSKLKMSSYQGFQKFDIVEMLTRKGKIVGYLNCFDKTTSGKSQKCRVKTSFTGDSRPSGNITQLRKIQCQDGYAYETAPANRDFFIPKPVSKPIPVITTNPVQLTLSI